MSRDFYLELDEASVELTLLSPSEERDCEGVDGPHERMALLTHRGNKDADIDADGLEKLGKACLKFAKAIREGR